MLAIVNMYFKNIKRNDRYKRLSKVRTPGKGCECPRATLHIKPGMQRIIHIMLVTSGHSGTRLAMLYRLRVFDPLPGAAPVQGFALTATATSATALSLPAPRCSHAVARLAALEAARGSCRGGARCDHAPLR